MLLVFSWESCSYLLL